MGPPGALTRLRLATARAERLKKDERMPCTYTGTLDGDTIMGLTEAINKARADAAIVTNLLCGVMESLDEDDKACVFGAVRGLLRWWQDHERLDQARQQAERDEKQRRAKVLAKLSPDERRLLGV